MITDSIFDIISNKNRRIVLEGNAPILSIEEIEAILIGVMNANPSYIAVIPNIIGMFREYLFFKEGETHEMVVTGEELLDSMLQEHFQHEDFSYFRQDT